MRNRLNFVSWKERKTLALDLKQIYHAATAEEAAGKLAEFEARWDVRYSSIGRLWRRHWAGVVGLFSFPEEIRKAIYTTNVVESLNMTLRKVIKTRASFPNEESALKLIYLALKERVPKMALRAELAHFTESLHAAMGRSDRSCSAAPHPIRWTKLAVTSSDNC